MVGMRSRPRSVFTTPQNRRRQPQSDEPQRPKHCEGSTLHRAGSATACPGMSRSRYKNVSLLSENLRFRGFVTSEREWEFLRRSRYARDERKNEYKKYTTACDESHFLRRHSSQERT